tara:strand:+ start:635 stop:928 length:294 start_codon:yes stop_codon:yes gene_type:complete
MNREKQRNMLVKFFWVLIMIGFLLGITGCGMMPVQKAYVPNMKSAKVPQNLVTRCDAIDSISQESNMGDLIRYTTDLMVQYNECAIRHDKLIETIKE